MTLYSILRSKYFSIAAVLLVGWLVLSVINVASHTNTLEEKESDLRNKSVKIEGDNEVLVREIEHAQNPSFLEKEARVKLNLKAPDEEVLFVYGTELVSPELSPESESINLEDLPNFKKWIYYILGY